MDNESNFYSEKPETLNNKLGRIQSARQERLADINSYNKGNKEALYTTELDNQIKRLQRISKIKKANVQLEADAIKARQKLNEFTELTNKNYLEYLEANKEAIEINQKLTKEVYKRSIQEAKTDKQREKLINKRNQDLEIYSDLLDDINRKIKNNNEANKSQLEAFSEGLHNLKDEIGKLAVIKGVGDITQGLFDKNSSTNMYNVYRNTSSQLGITGRQFNDFKIGLTKQLADTNNLLNFGWKDTADYLNKLGELNITSQEMAEEQYLAVLQGTKYLGLTTETQAKILKISKDTGRSDLLQQTNETMVQIMNAQLGVNKEQLNQMVNQAAQLADMSVFLGGSGDVVQNLTKIQAAVTREYGKSTSDAAMSILTQIMNDPANNKYLSNGFLGPNYNKIVQYAQNGQMDEAIKLIIESVKSSRSTSVAKENMYAANALGADANIMAIANSSGNMSNVDRNMTSIEKSSSDIAQTIAEFNQDWSDKILNAGSNILAMLPFSQVLTLQNVYYALATIELLTKLPATMKVITGYLAGIFRNTGISSMSLDKNSPMSMFGNVGKISASLAAISLLVTGISMGISDAAKGVSNADKWGVGKTSAAIGGFLGGSDDNKLIRVLKNMGKYAAIGAAIGIIVPGIGNVAGAIIGGIVGLAVGFGLGEAGGEGISNFIDNIFGRRKDVDKGAGPTSTFIPHLPSTGGKGAVSGGGSYPWVITSPFGPRTLDNGDNTYHSGVDWGIATGTKVGTPVDGTVVSMQKDDRNTYPNGPTSAGNWLYIQGKDGVLYQFGHLSYIGVRNGQNVQAGQAVALSGNTGYSTGPHLHFGTKVNGSWVNPLSYVRSGLFSANGDLYIDPAENNNQLQGETLLQKVVSADTVSSNGRGAYEDGGEKIVFAVNSGFASLNDKLEELSTRQNNQEAVLRQLTASKGSKVYEY